MSYENPSLIQEIQKQINSVTTEQKQQTKRFKKFRYIRILRKIKQKTIKMTDEEQYNNAVREFIDKIVSGDEFANTRRAYAMFKSTQAGYGDQVRRILGDYAYDLDEINIPTSEGPKNYLDNKLKETRKKDKNGNPIPGTGRFSEGEMGQEIGEFMQAAYQQKTFGELVELAGGDPNKVKEDYKDTAVKDVLLSDEKKKEQYDKIKNAQSEKEELKARKKLEGSQFYEQIYSQVTQEIDNYNIIKTLKETLPEAEKDPGKNLETLLGEEDQN